jgi:hypothetical protein
VLAERPSHATARPDGSGAPHRGSERNRRIQQYVAGAPPVGHTSERDMTGKRDRDHDEPIGLRHCFVVQAACERTAAGQVSGLRGRILCTCRVTRRKTAQDRLCTPSRIASRSRGCPRRPASTPSRSRPGLPQGVPTLLHELLFAGSANIGAPRPVSERYEVSRPRPMATFTKNTGNPC